MSPAFSEPVTCLMSHEAGAGDNGSCHGDMGPGL